MHCVDSWKIFLVASEFELDGYNVFYDGGKDDSSRGILVYASAEISAAY